MLIINRKTDHFTKRITDLRARDLISSSECRELSLEHNVPLGFFLVEGGVAGNHGGVLQNANYRFFFRF